MKILDDIKRWWATRDKGVVYPGNSDIGEPVLSILEAMKDVSRWNMSTKTVFDNLAFCYGCSITDSRTQNTFILTKTFYVPWTGVHYDVLLNWVTDDERTLLIEAAKGLVEDLKSIRLKEEKEEREQTNKTERERLIRDYCK